MYDWNFPFKVICFCTSGLLAVLLLILDGTVKLPGHPDYCAFLSQTELTFVVRIIIRLMRTNLRRFSTWRPNSVFIERVLMFKVRTGA